MAQKTKAELQAFFGNGDKPTENEFEHIFDSFLNKEEGGTVTGDLSLNGTTSCPPGSTFVVNGGVRYGSTIINQAALSLNVNDHSSKPMVLSRTSGTCTITLPEATGMGDRYYFTLGKVSYYVIKVQNSGEWLMGHVLISDPDNNTGPSDFHTTFTGNLTDDIPTNSDTIILNGTSAGGNTLGAKFLSLT